MDAETGSRALHAANDLVELLQLAEGALERVAREVHGIPFEQADQIAREMRRLLRLAERLQAEAERLVASEQAASEVRGHPLRRSTDHHSSFS
jgi:hypothetical protein